MAKKLNGITYPDTIDELLGDNALARPFKRYLKDKLLNTDLQFLQTKSKMQVIYENYLHTKAPMALNISGPLQKRVDREFADQKWKDSKRLKAYEACVKDVRADVRKTITSDTLLGRTYTFWDSKHFKEVHAANLRKKVKLDSKKLRVLGFENVTDKRVKETLMDAIVHFANRELSMGQRVFKKLKKLEPANSMGANIKPEKANAFLLKMKVYPA